MAGLLAESGGPVAVRSGSGWSAIVLRERSSGMVTNFKNRHDASTYYACRLPRLAEPGRRAFVHPPYTLAAASLRSQGPREKTRASAPGRAWPQLSPALRGDRDRREFRASSAPGQLR